MYGQKEIYTKAETAPVMTTSFVLPVIAKEEKEKVNNEKYKYTSCMRF